MSLDEASRFPGSMRSRTTYGTLSSRGVDKEEEARRAEEFRLYLLIGTTMLLGALMFTSAASRFSGPLGRETQSLDVNGVGVLPSTELDFVCTNRFVVSLGSRPGRRDAFSFVD